MVLIFLIFNYQSERLTSNIQNIANDNYLQIVWTFRNDNNYGFAKVSLCLLFQFYSKE